MPEVAQVRDPGLFHVRQVAAVVDDAHRVGLGEPDPDAMVEGIRRRDRATAQRRGARCAPYRWTARWTESAGAILRTC